MNLRYPYCFALAAMLVSASVSSVAHADAIAWRKDYAAARAESAASGRPLLLHFGATWCGPCKRVERKVFTNPEAIAVINAQFVPVKIDVDDHPELKKQFTVSSIPADLVVAPDGRIVQRETGDKTAAVYVASLRRAQTYYVQSVAAARRAVPQMPAMQMSAMGGAHANQAVVAGVGFQASPQVIGPPRGHQSVAPATPSAMSRQQPFPVQQPIPHQVIPQQFAVQQPVARPPVAQQPPTVASVGPAGSPFVFEGFCPVSLTERGEWTAGRKEYGLRHRGRTYLFAGPDEWQRFNANPDKYTPLASGFDPVLLVDANQQVDGRRCHGVTYQGQVLLFASEETLGRFVQDKDRYVALVRRTVR
jgi:thiol-disulfide isomerase/thioredoxin/YHS domain-containing protein